MQFKKENRNLYFVTASILASLVFYAITLSISYQDISAGSSLKLYQQQQAKQAD